MAEQIQTWAGLFDFLSSLGDVSASSLVRAHELAVHELHKREVRRWPIVQLDDTRRRCFVGCRHAVLKDLISDGRPMNSEGLFTCRRRPYRSFIVSDGIVFPLLSLRSTTRLGRDQIPLSSPLPHKTPIETLRLSLSTMLTGFSPVTANFPSPTLLTCFGDAPARSRVSSHDGMVLGLNDRMNENNLPSFINISREAPLPMAI